MKKKKYNPTQSMSYTEFCDHMGIDHDVRLLLWSIINRTNSATLNHADQVRSLIGNDKLDILRKWLYQ